MKFDVESYRLSDLIGSDKELVVYDSRGAELRTLKGVIVRGGRQLNAGESVRVRHKHAAHPPA